MYVKLSDTIERFATEVAVAGMSRKIIEEKLSLVGPDDVAEVIRILKSPSEKIMKTAGRAPGVAALLLILTTLLGSAFADVDIKKDVADELLKLKGQVTFQDLDNFKKDLPKTGLEPGAATLKNLNKLIETAKGAEIPENFSSAPVTIGGEKLMPNSPEEVKALAALSKLVNDMAKAVQTAEDKTALAKKTKALVQAFKTKKPIQFS